MKTKLSILALSLLAAVGLTASASAAAESDKEVEARKQALDLAGAFSNDGFKIRDGHWSGTIKPRERAVIAVNLYAGNHYWFSVGAADQAKKLEVTVYDETGQQVTTESYSDEKKAAAGFSPTNSGQYFVAVGVLEGGEGSICFLYSYK